QGGGNTFQGVGQVAGASEISLRQAGGQPFAVATVVGGKAAQQVEVLVQVSPQGADSRLGVDVGIGRGNFRQLGSASTAQGWRWHWRFRGGRGVVGVIPPLAIEPVQEGGVE